ncbi:unnamed protein product [Cuscuta campestris]|uniref:Uncharacterized protein n=2 Tax=Cuscuta sect. Cleistogrammica TaxID=1824901 RepID=A0A484MVP9_9ASTE|nr:hypothetical protein DM860_008928 [Cuscuta australis]VFQ92930.1 unnamed protein product [Cuscuta campestris]
MEEGFLDKIRPPRLEDAGLEDCALPLESIKEAFLKAASAVRSSAISPSDGDADGSCVDDPWPVAADSSDSLIGIADGIGGSTDSCVTEKGTEAAGDEVVVVGAGEKEEKSDALVAPGVPEGGQACIDSLKGLSIGENAKNSSTNRDDDGDDDQLEDQKTKKPTLIEDCF